MCLCALLARACLCVACVVPYSTPPRFFKRDHIVRPHIEDLLRLHPHFRIGVFSSATVRTVNTALETLYAALQHSAAQRGIGEQEQTQTQPCFYQWGILGAATPATQQCRQAGCCQRQARMRLSDVDRHTQTKHMPALDSCAVLTRLDLSSLLNPQFGAQTPAACAGSFNSEPVILSLPLASPPARLTPPLPLQMACCCLRSMSCST